MFQENFSHIIHFFVSVENFSFPVYNIFLKIKSSGF